MIRAILILTAVLTFTASAIDQSGRRKAPVVAPTASPTPTPSESPKPSEPKAPQVTAEKNQDYRCTDDGTLAHLMDDPDSVKAFQPKEVDVRAEVTARPDPKYTEEARRLGVQGVVTLKVLLSADDRVDRVRVLRRLPYGLTESAIRAACQIKFKPAQINGQKVPQWVNVEYGFSLAKSSIYGP
jgi:periplasmic protein TonB